MIKYVITLLHEKPHLGAIASFGGLLGAISLQPFLGILSGLIGVGIGSITLIVAIYNAGGIEGIWAKLKKWKYGNNNK